MLTIKVQPVRTPAQVRRAVRALVRFLREAGWGNEQISAALATVAKQIFK